VPFGILHALGEYPVHSAGSEARRSAATADIIYLGVQTSVFRAERVGGLVVCTENSIRVDDVMESLKLAE
jgi:hypothetical protein